MSLLLSSRRAARNRRAATLFVNWARHQGYSFDNSNAVLLTALVEWIQDQWNNEESKEIISDCLQSLKYLTPGNDVHLALPSRMFRKWSNQELPIQATSATPDEALSLAGLPFKDGYFGLAVSV